MSLNSIKTKSYTIHFNSECYMALNNFLNAESFSKLFVLVDTNTHEHCLSKFMAQIETTIPFEIIEIESGEHYKTIDTCVGVWNALSELDADRKSLMLNLGGGVVTDLGGFVASTFKRGIAYINIPTSLLAMVDASVGGKTGVDLGTLKNQIGVINSGEMVLIDTSFLETLPQNHLRSGLAEMLKHGLIEDRSYFNTLSDLSQLTLHDLDRLIYDSVIIKNNIVTKDPHEDGIRKHLNFGHTLGHAIESYCLDSDQQSELLHGEAIAIGMIMECYLSSKLVNFPQEDLEFVTNTFLSMYDAVAFTEKDHAPIIELLKYDKKNSHGNINFVLLEAIGQPTIDCLVPNDLILEAFQYYNTAILQKQS